MKQIVKNKNKHNKALASEEFNPNLSDFYLGRYGALLERLKLSIPTNYRFLFENEINAVNQLSVEKTDEIEHLKYLATLNV